MTLPAPNTVSPTGSARAVGAVAIGRNEGERLVRCLESLASALRGGGDLRLVYVDSGSSDGSRERAAVLGARVLPLDLSQPFTAARARNAGLALLLDQCGPLEFVLFVDGDCELEPGFLEAARSAMDANPTAAAVAGRRRERFPARSRYNQLCDLEWDTPVGEAEAVGGDALYRTAALVAVGGFDPGLIAGEEPELCYRLRRAGHRILCIDAPMTVHDAAMVRFSQWWRRTVRSGHAAAELWAMHGRGGARAVARIAQSALVWTVAVPVFALGLGGALALLVGPSGWLLAPAVWLGANVRLVARVTGHRIARGSPRNHGLLYGFFCALGKWPEAVGVLRYAVGRISGRRSRLIEYKGPPTHEIRARGSGSAAP